MVTREHPLYNVRGKISRAEEHIDALASYTAESLGDRFKRISIGLYYDRDAGEHVLYVSKMPDLSTELQRASLILGDAVHNLRSSLDHLVCQLAIAHTKNNVRKMGAIQFPICDTEDFWKQQKARRLQEVAPDDCTKIQRFQPFMGKDLERSIGKAFHPLVMLRYLSNLDKHQRIIKVAIPTASIFTLTQYGGIFEVLFHSQAKRWEQRMMGIDPIELNIEIARAPTHSSLPKEKVEVVGYINPQIAFAEGRAVIPVIESVTSFVIKLIHKFEPSF